MDTNKVDYDTIVRFGSLQDFKNKMKKQREKIGKIISIVDEDGSSLLESCLSTRNFEIAKYLLDNSAPVNVCSIDGFNEFHYIASNINEDGALDIANLLLEKGTSLEQQDKKYGNSAFFTLCIEAFKKKLPLVMSFLEECFKKFNDIDKQNFSGISVRDLINERGSENLKRMVAEK